MLFLLRLTLLIEPSWFRGGVILQELVGDLYISKKISVSCPPTSKFGILISNVIVGGWRLLLIM